MKECTVDKRFCKPGSRRWLTAACLLVSLWNLSFSFPTLLLSQQTLGLEDAIRLAMAQNPAIQASLAAESSAQERSVQARAGYLPEVNYSESLQWGNNPVYVFGALLEQRRFRSSNFDIGSLNHPDALTNFASQLTVDQVLFDGNKTRHRLQAASAARGMAAQHRRRSEMEILETVVETYYEAVVAQEMLRVAEEAVRTAQADLQRALTLRDVGRTTEADVLAMRVRLAEVEDQRIRARNDLEISQTRLNNVLAVPLEARYNLSTPLRPARSPVTSLEQLEQYETLALRERPEARSAEMALTLAEANRNLARANLLPEMMVHGALEANRQSFAARGGSNWMLGATLRVNLFRGFADRSRLAESSFLKTQREQEQRSTQSALRLEVRQSFLELQAASHRIDVAQTATAEAEERHRIVANRYEAGLSEATELLHSQTALSAAQTRYLSAVFDQRVASVRLERAAGALNSSSEAVKP